MATLAAPPPPADRAIAHVDISHPDMFASGDWLPTLARMRRETPVAWHPEGRYGPYWSVATHKDIVQVESLPDLYSSSWQHGGITVLDADPEMPLPMFIAMDRPEHTGQRRTVAPAFTPSEMQRLSVSIRQRTGALLDELPVGDTFDWVDTVSIELTTQMLATLFDFPWDDRRLLTEWSDVMGDVEAASNPDNQEARQAILWGCAGYFNNLWNERKAADPAPDLLSMMIHSDHMSNMDERMFLGNLILLIVGGNDTTRNSMSGAIQAFNQYPDEWRKIVADPSLIPNAASELIRWQTPLAYMRRTATEDTELGNQPIAKGEKLLLWYISANRDEAMFENGDAFVADRPNARRHLSFGHGIHRCVGARLAELQLTILMEEMLARGMSVEQTGTPGRVHSSFIHGYKSMPVRMTRR